MTLAGNSTEAQASTTGPCTVGPSFAGIGSATNAATSTCTLNLAWPAAATRCGGGVTYRVHRSTTAPFTPSAANLVASGLSGNSFTDHDTLSNAASYFYIVRAVDAGNGADDGNAVTVSASPTGVNSVGTWTDNAGDTGTTRMTPSLPWSVKPTGRNPISSPARASALKSTCAVMSCSPTRCRGSLLLRWLW